jgi:L-iditol 2-dehydrogenase
VNPGIPGGFHAQAASPASALTATLMAALSKASSLPEDVKVVPQPVPQPGGGELLLQTLACGLCGSDVHAWRQDTGYEWVKTPVTLGHEAVGRVVDCGAGVSKDWIGRLVVPIAIDGCGDCSLCVEGNRQLCRGRSVLGLSFNGCASEYFVLPAHRAIATESTLPAATLALAEPLSVALHAVKRLIAAVDKSSTIIVSGPGPIGLMGALLLNDHGFHVLLMGAARDEDQRLPLARSLGLNTFVAGQPLPAEIGGWLEASGATLALQSAITTVRPGGAVILAGLFPAVPPVDVNVLARNEIRLLGSYGSVAQDYRDALAALESAPERWSSLVTTVPLSDGTSALRTAAEAGAVKVVLIP